MKRAYGKVVLAREFCPDCSDHFMVDGPDCPDCGRPFDVADEPPTKEIGPWTGPNTSATGAISELLVAADMAKQGYEVFRAISPSASCDLVAMRDGRLFRVEVRTSGHYAPTRLRFVARNRIGRDRQDLVAVVHRVGNGEKIVYHEPEAIQA